MLDKLQLSPAMPNYAGAVGNIGVLTATNATNSLISVS